jgi:hypothetical protein
MQGLRETTAAATSVGPTRRPLAVSSVRLTRRPRGADSSQATSLHVIRSHATSVHEIAHMQRVLAKK